MSHVLSDSDCKQVGLADITRQPLSELIKLLRSPYPKIRDQVRQLLLARGYLEQTADILRSSKTRAERVTAAQTLGLLGDEAACIHLIPTLFDADYAVRQAGAGALHRLGEPFINVRFVEWLLRETDFESSRGQGIDGSQRHSSDSFGIQSDWASSATHHTRIPADSPVTTAYQTVSEVALSFDDPSTSVRAAAAIALSNIEPSRSADFFSHAFNNALPERRVRIGQALVESGLGRKAIDALVDANRDSARNALCLLFIMARTGAIQPFIDAIERHPSGDVRRTAIKLLDLCAQSEIAEAAVKRRLGI